MNKTLLVGLFAATIAVTGCQTTNPEKIDASINEAGAKVDSKASAIESKKADLNAKKADCAKKKADLKAQKAMDKQTEKHTAKGINKAKDSAVNKITK